MARPQPLVTMRRLVRSPLAVHLASVAVAIPVLVFLARGQWFFYDEWTFLDHHGSLLDAHNGHMSLLPLLVYKLLASVVGLSSYWPYELLVLAVHLVVVHLLWRVAVRSGVAPWVATLLALPMLVLGAGAENILWAFQIGFLGAIAFGLGAVLVLSRPRGPLGLGAGGLLTAASLCCSGTALPLLAGTIVVAWRIQGWRRALVTLALPIVLFGAWYLGYGLRPVMDVARAHGLLAIANIPAYMGTMYAGGFERLFPLPGLGAVSAAALLIAGAATAGRLLGDRERWLPTLLFLAGLAFSALTAYQRIGLGLEAASSGRYVYVVVGLSLPLTGLLVTGLLRRWRALLVPVLAVALAMCVAGVSVLAQQARLEQSRELATHQQMSAAVTLARTEPDRVDLSQAPDPVWAAGISVRDLVRLHDRGLFPIVATTAATRLAALVNVTVWVSKAAATPDCRPLGDAVLIPDGGEIVVKPADAGAGTLTITDGVDSSADRALPGSDPVEVRNHSGAEVSFEPSAGTELCG